MRRSGILHIKSAPYDPATNGCTEIIVRTFKNTFRKMEWSGSLNEKLNTFLFTYKITELLMNRKLNSKFNIIKPGADLNKNVFLPNAARQFKVGDEVWIRNFSIGNKRLP